MPARYVRAFLKGNKNDFRDAEAIEEAVQRPTMRFEGGLLTLVCQVSRWKKLGRLSSIVTGLFGSREGAQTTVIARQSG